MLWLIVTRQKGVRSQLSNLRPQFDYNRVYLLHMYITSDGIVTTRVYVIVQSEFSLFTVITRDIRIIIHCSLVRHMASWILVNIGSGNDLLSDGTKPLPEINVESSSIESSRTGFNEILAKCQSFLFKNMHVKMSPAKRRTYLWDFSAVKT